MTATELALFKEAVYWYSKYDDSNPDVGMGNPSGHFVDDVVRRTGITASADERRSVAAWLDTVRGNR